MDIATIIRGYSDGSSVDTSTAASIFFFKNTKIRGYSDNYPWIQRRKSVDTSTEIRGYIDDKPWIHRRQAVDTSTVRRGYSDGLGI